MYYISIVSYYNDSDMDHIVQLFAFSQKSILYKAKKYFESKAISVSFSNEDVFAKQIITYEEMGGKGEISQKVCRYIVDHEKRRHHEIGPVFIMKLLFEHNLVQLCIKKDSIIFSSDSKFTKEQSDIIINFLKSITPIEYHQMIDISLAN